MFAKKSFLLFVFSICFVCESAFVDNLGKCKVTDGECQRDLFQSVLRDISKTGIPELGIPPIDPFPVKNVSVSILNMVEISMVDGVAKGIKDCIVNKMETHVEKEHATMEMTCDVTVKGRYKVIGSSPIIKNLLGGETIHGDGIGKVKLEKFHMKFDYHILVKEIDGEVYIKCQYEDLKYSYTLGKATFAANNIYVGKTEANDVEFIRRYRLNKRLTRDLCDELSPLFKKPTKATDLTVEEKVLTALSFYATGSYQRPIGDIAGHSVAQQTVSAALSQVTAALNSSQMRRKYIVFPNCLDERNATRTQFHQRFGIPGVLGCIDCTQVAIVRPNEHEDRYRCRKGYHSLNVQLICDANMQITSVDSSFGGANHDSFIWNSHPVKVQLEGLNEQTWLLGEFVTSFLNQNWKWVMDTFGKPFLDKAMDIAYEQSHKFFDVVPTKYYLLEDLSQYIKN